MKNLSTIKDRKLFLTTSALVPLFLFSAQPAGAVCNVTAAAWDCYGDLSAGFNLSIVSPQSLTVSNLSTNIGPAAGTSGLGYSVGNITSSTAHGILNVVTGAYKITTTDAPAIDAYVANGNAGTKINAMIETSGSDAAGTQIETDQGDVSLTGAGSIMTTGQNSAGISATAFQNDSLNGSRLNNFLKNGVDVDYSGTIMTSGDMSNGIEASASSVGVMIAEGKVKLTGDIITQGSDSHGIVANARTINISVNGNVDTSGANAFGVAAQTSGSARFPDESVKVDITAGSSVSGGSGTGAGVRLVSNGGSSITNHGQISALSGYAIVVTAPETPVMAARASSNAAAFNLNRTGGDDEIRNYGTVTGNVDLAGGKNLFHNHESGAFNAGRSVYVGPGNKVVNEGRFQSLGKTPSNAGSSY